MRIERRRLRNAGKERWNGEYKRGDRGNCGINQRKKNKFKKYEIRTRELKKGKEENSTCL
jgi:hypothetical protein